MTQTADRGPARPGADRAAEGHRRASLKRRSTATAPRSTTSRPPPRTRPGPRGPGPDRRRGDQQDLPLRRQGRADHLDRQRGAARRAAPRPLEPDRGQRDVFAKLAADDGSLSDLITNFNTTPARWRPSRPTSRPRSAAGADARAGPAVAAPPEQTLPPFRALRSRLEPGISELPATIRAGTPWLVQPRKLLQTGRARRHRQAAGLMRRPALAQDDPRVARRSSRSSAWSSRCVSHNLVPAGQHGRRRRRRRLSVPTGQPNYREFLYGAVQLAGESQGFDGNGPFVRVQAGGGPRRWSRCHNPGRPVTPKIDYGRTTSRRRSAPARCCRQAARRRSGRTSPATRERPRPERPAAAPGPPDPATRFHEARDPRTPARLHRDHRPGRPGARVDRRDPLPAAANFPSWIPVLGDDRFELKAEFPTAQAVTPARARRSTSPGSRSGRVGRQPRGRRAVVTMDIDPKYAQLIHPDASLLLRPRTGLQDMTIELDPGTEGQRGPGGLHDPARADRAERQPRPDPRLARRRHPRLPAAAAPGGRPGARRRQRPASSRPRCAASSRPPATSPRSTARSRSGARTCAA